MIRKEFYLLVQPLTEKLYRFAHAILPDDLQAEQLVVDSLNAYLIKEKKNILGRQINLQSKKEIQILRRIFFKGILRYMSDIGLRRAQQLGEQFKLDTPTEFKAFYNLEPKARMVLKLRYEAQFSVEEIEEIVQIPRYQVIEKIHNGRFLIVTDLNQGVAL